LAQPRPKSQRSSDKKIRGLKVVPVEGLEPTLS
jgi:hypothetical protein